MTDGTNALKIPKSRLPVELTLSGRVSRQVELFVSDQRSRLRRRLAVLSLLTQEEPFIPAQDVETKEWLLFNRDEVTWVSVTQSQTTDSDDIELELFDQRCLIRVELNDGSSLEGELLFSSPTTGQRVVDHLNRRESFFFLFRNESAFLINKASVTAVVEMSQCVQEGEDLGED